VVESDGRMPLPVPPSFRPHRSVPSNVRTTPYRCRAPCSTLRGSQHRATEWFGTPIAGETRTAQTALSEPVAGLDSVSPQSGWSCARKPPSSHHLLAVVKGVAAADRRGEARASTAPLLYTPMPSAVSTAMLLTRSRAVFSLHHFELCSPSSY
jgi:hypothetical protein